MITRERARELRAVIEGAVSTYDMEDSEALKVVELFPDVGDAPRRRERTRGKYHLERRRSPL